MNARDANDAGCERGLAELGVFWGLTCGLTISLTLWLLIFAFILTLG